LLPQGGTAVGAETLVAHGLSAIGTFGHVIDYRFEQLIDI
jgi:hypothetical protein